MNVGGPCSRPRVPQMVVPRILASLLASTLLSCGTPDPENALTSNTDERQGSACETQKTAPDPLPGVLSEHESAEYWIKLHPSPERELLTAAQIERHNLSLQRKVEDDPLGRADLDAAPEAESVHEQVKTRINYMREKLEAGAYVDAEGNALDGADLAAFTLPEALPALSPENKLAAENVPLRCGPRLEGLYKSPVDVDFDRNSCSMIRKGERLQILARWGRMWLARTAYSMGWIAEDAKLETYAARTEPTKHVRPLTYRNLVEEAFRYQDKPYGWGGRAGAQDCSRFVMDVFESFGVELPRNSGRQALAGSYSVLLDGVENPKDRKELIKQAAKDGAVLLHFPGHIMLYLGENEDGEPMAIHAFSEYLERCPADGSDVTVRADRVAVSDLTLGKNSSRRSFLERISLLTVLGQAPSNAIRGAATKRSAVMQPEAWEKLTRGRARACQDNLAAAMFRSPVPVTSESSSRVIASFEKSPGFAELFLRDPKGNWSKPPTELLGGPPFTFVATLHKPTKGRWTALVADGKSVVSCERFNVRRFALEPAVHNSSKPRTVGAWRDHWKWEKDTENLYAAFVERLFDEPKDSETTWPDLHTLLRDPERNLLHSHLGQGEDDALELGPDCADLPYFLRAYFAWKMRLPFGYRRCSRGAAGTPPACHDLRTNREALFDELRQADAASPEDKTDRDTSREEALARNNGLSDVEAFKLFSRKLASGVHSASARTHPKAEATDVYPVALERASLKPGTVFADPYGHLLVVAKWWPQTATNYGVLVGADAQPDGTIGRRRFWRGSFLFTPKTDDVGAGFKMWRPIIENEDVEDDEDEAPSALIALDNEALRTSKAYRPYSLEQYEDSREAFYVKMEGLINPRPLDPIAYMTALVDALDESVKRRIVSVENGVSFMKKTDWATIEMPSGHDIFETQGAWEDYATPARDLRLLISLDAVLNFPAEVAQSPARFGVDTQDAPKVEKRLRETLGLLLAARRYSYEQSNGTRKELRLADIAERAASFEMAYNPNDCVEIRWGAPAHSEERSNCAQRAPQAQQKKMAQYRTWFERRERPAR